MWAYRDLGLESFVWDSQPTDSFPMRDLQELIGYVLGRERTRQRCGAESRTWPTVGDDSGTSVRALTLTKSLTLFAPENVL